jgi:multiple sugar transport system permease protein
MTAVTTPAPPARSKTTKPSKGRTRGVGRLAAMLLSPTFLVLALVVGYPILAAIRLSFYQQNEGVDPNTGLVQQGSRFAGLDNFVGMFTGDTGTRFLNAFWNTTTFTVVSVGIECIIGVAMALIMNKAFRGRGLIRASILVPWAVPTAITALLFQWIFQANGIANEIVPGAPLWTADNGYSWLAVVIADTWKTAPFIGILVLAGLQVIPAEVYEAAKIDGASAWATLWRITLPLVRPALVVAVLFRLLDVLRMFDLPYVMIGQGKPSVETLSMLAFAELNQRRYGPAGAYSIALFLYIAVVAFVFVKVLGADIVGARVGKGIK